MGSSKGSNVTARQSSSIKRLIETFMKEVSDYADEEDWQESDGWVGKMVIKTTDGDEEYIYRVSAGRMEPTTSNGPYVAVMTMYDRTLIELIETALTGRDVEAKFAEKYAARHISYQGDRWVVDTERFRKVFKRLGARKRG